MNSQEILLEDCSMGIPKTAMSCFKSTKKAEAFTNLLLNNGLCFVNGRSKTDGAANVTFINGKSSSIIDYVIVNMEAWSSILDMAVVSRVESDNNPLVLVMRTHALGLGITTGQVPGLHKREIVQSNCRRTIRWDDEMYRQGLTQLEYIIANYGQSIVDALANESPLILAAYDQMTRELGALWSKPARIKSDGFIRKGQLGYERWFDKECAKAKREVLVALIQRHSSSTGEMKFKEYRRDYKCLLVTKKWLYQNAMWAELRASIVNHNITKVWELVAKVGKGTANFVETHIGPAAWVHHFSTLYRTRVADPLAPGHRQGALLTSTSEIGI
ncbi:hypothetical protein NDU88_004793 [Pleurodeles waltl]|uniref:Reverse transcriptase n=1 Tax=Pleurodeles waltl TaxID=8319 RepID=A0AAV7T942_PLEWA|nr:hypothetical protein NDU88_004793 [Pleurodeles waltl]